jgi:hypothetical protein
LDGADIQGTCDAEERERRLAAATTAVTVIDATAEIRLGATIHAYPSALYAEERVLLCIGYDRQVMGWEVDFPSWALQLSC